MSVDPAAARQAFARWRAAVQDNFLTADPHLRHLLRHYGREHAEPELIKFGRLAATQLDEWARQTNREGNTPRLARYDGQGRRTEGVDFDARYHDLGRAVYGTGLMGLYREAGHEFETLGYMYLLSHCGEAGHACPLACTAGLIKILQADGGHDDWLERLYDPSYDTHFHGSQFLTEVQGGSDVGANAVVAREEQGEWRLYGEKWFCSVVDAQLFLVTARPEGGEPGTAGVRAFAVPRVHRGEPNGFRIRRLKDKLGTRSMASAEVDFEGAVATPVGDLKRVLELVLTTSRLYNAVCSTGMMQRALLEAWHYAHQREAFGGPLVQFPLVRRQLVGMATGTWATRALSCALADLSDCIATGRASERDARAFRMLVNLHKYWSSYRGTSTIRTGIELLGGNGAIEEFSVLPRLLRDSIVCEAWEGSHNVLCAQALRDSVRHGLHADMFDWLGEQGGDLVAAALAGRRAEWDNLLAMDAAAASLAVREVVDRLEPVAQAAVMVAQACPDERAGWVVEELLSTRGELSGQLARDARWFG